MTLFFHLPDKFLRYSEVIKFKGGYIHEEENMDEMHCRLSSLALSLRWCLCRQRLTQKKQGRNRYPGAASGGAASIATPTPTATASATPTPTATASAMPTPTATVNPALYELDAPTVTARGGSKPGYAFVEQGDRSEWLLYLFS